MAEQRIEFGRPQETASGCGSAGGCACGHGDAVDAQVGAVDDRAATVTELQVDGMTCAHCVRAVTAELRSLPGVRDVSIDLVTDGTSRVHVRSEAPLDDDAVDAAIVEAGYRLHV